MLAHRRCSISDLWRRRKNSKDRIAMPEGLRGAVQQRRLPSWRSQKSSDLADGDFILLYTEGEFRTSGTGTSLGSDR